MREFTKEQFEEFIHEIIPQQLFHVMPTDIDDETGVRCDEIILLGLLHQTPEVLRYKSLAWFVEYFITNESKEQLLKSFAKYHNKRNGLMQRIQDNEILEFIKSN